MTIKTAKGTTVKTGFNLFNGSRIVHTKYGKGKAIGFIDGKYIRVQFDNNEVKDFLPEIFFSH